MTPYVGTYHTTYLLQKIRCRWLPPSNQPHIQQQQQPNMIHHIRYQYGPPNSMGNVRPFVESADSNDVNRPPPPSQRWMAARRNEPAHRTAQNSEALAAALGGGWTSTPRTNPHPTGRLSHHPPISTAGKVAAENAAGGRTQDVAVALP